MLIPNHERDEELARIREEMRRTRQEIARLVREEMAKARHRARRQSEGAKLIGCPH